VNRQLRTLFFFLCLLFVAVIATSTYWLWRSPDLEARRDNPTLLVRQVTIKRGLIYASDRHTVLAANRQRNVQGQTWYVRRYPQRSLAADVVGYSTVARSRAGLEDSLNDFLTGSNGSLKSVLLDRTLDKIRGLTQQGNDLYLTIDVRAQRAAAQALAGKCGAAVALDVQTGAVRVMATSPTYDPNLVEHDFGKILSQAGPCPDPAPLLNRASAGLFIPGSTFKVITSRRTASSTTQATASSTARRSSTSPTSPDQRCSGRCRSARRSSTRSTPCSATSARSSDRSSFSSTQNASASTTARRSRRPTPSGGRAASTWAGPAGASSSRKTPTRSTRGASRSARSACSSPRCRWRWSRQASPTGAS